MPARKLLLPRISLILFSKETELNKILTKVFTVHYSGKVGSIEVIF